MCQYVNGMFVPIEIQTFLKIPLQIYQFKDQTFITGYLDLFIYTRINIIKAVRLGLFYRIESV